MLKCINLFLSHQIVFPDLALLRFGVVDDNDKLIAQRVVPLDGLQSGRSYVFVGKTCIENLICGQ